MGRFRRRVFSITFALTALSPAATWSASIVSGPWLEAVISVSDLDRTAAFFLQVGGYQVRWRGTVDRSVLDYWQLPSEASAEAMVLAPEWAKTGLVRLVRFEGVPQVPTRPGARPWDTGCYLSLMLRGKDLNARYMEVVRLGWWTESDIVSFRFGTSQLKNVVFKGPDGIGVAVYERLAPPLSDFWPDFQRLSQPFNSMQTVRDRDATHDFFDQVLGFQSWYKGKPSTADQPTYSNFSVPTHLTTSVRVRAGIQHPEPGEVGRMEFIEFMDLPGRDYSDRCLPPNLGILSIRYPVDDIGEARKRIEQAGAAMTYPPREILVAPHGSMTSLAIQSPDGGMVELFQLRGGK